jgi:chitinase
MYWSEAGKTGDIHRSGLGPFYEARYDHSHTVNFPPAGQDNAHWFYRGERAGTFADPKGAGEVTYVGAIHRNPTIGTLYKVKMLGVVMPFPVGATDNEYWSYQGESGGTFSSFKRLGEPAYKGAIYRGDRGAFMWDLYASKVDGPTSAGETPFPPPGEENTWWKPAGKSCSLTASTPTSVNEFNERVPAGGYLDIQSLINRVPSNKASTLLSGVRAPVLELRSKEGDYVVRSANLLDEKRGDIVGDIVLVTRKDGAAWSLINTPTHKGMLMGDVKGEQRWIEHKDDDTDKVDFISLPDEPVSAKASSDAATDCAGNYIVDVLAGYSRSADAFVGNSVAYGLAQMESANLGLRNSNIGVRLRLAAAVTIEQDYGVTTETLDLVESLFLSAANESGADVVAAYFYPHAGSTAGGWGYLGGNFTVNQADNPNVFRHEVGHNAGGSHCSDGVIGKYKFGFARLNTTPTRKTFMCGNNTPFYSSPRVLDEGGQPRGDGGTADMARTWSERAPAMSGYRKVLSYPEGTIP